MIVNFSIANDGHSFGINWLTTRRIAGLNNGKPMKTEPKFGRNSLKMEEEEGNWELKTKMDLDNGKVRATADNPKEITLMFGRNIFGTQNCPNSAHFYTSFSLLLFRI